jgi:hypothetical protein
MDAYALDFNGVVKRYGRFGAGRTTAAVNRVVTGCLLAADVGILEIRCGSGLEHAYLEQAGAG